MVPTAQEQKGDSISHYLTLLITDDGHEDRNVETILLMDLCEMQCSLECRQVACKLSNFT